MADPNVVNIKGLPRVEEIVNGNLLIVENEQGTNTLDFVNFVIGPNNTSFYNEITDLSNQLVSLSSEAASQITNLTNTTQVQLSGLETYFNSRYDNLSSSVLDEVDTIVTELSSDVSSKLNLLSGYFHASGVARFTINELESDLQSFTKPYAFDISPNDISLTAAVALTSNPYIFESDITNAGTGTSFTIKLTNIHSSSGNIVRWSVNKVYYIPELA